MKPGATVRDLCAESGTVPSLYCINGLFEVCATRVFVCWGISLVAVERDYAFSACGPTRSRSTRAKKSLSAIIRSPFPREGDRTFRYASLASGLDIVRKSLGQHEIAIVQTTTIDQGSSQIRLTTLLAHASGEWISSDWPVCPISETDAPHRMGAALTYARRYALFALVGIAGEDDLNAPDLLVERSPAIEAPVEPGKEGPNNRGPRNGSVHKPRQPKPVLAAGPSAALRDQLVGEILELKDGEGLAHWAHRRLPTKNTLTADDARAVEAAYQGVLNTINNDAPDQRGQVPGPISESRSTSSENGGAVAHGSTADGQQPSTAETVSSLRKPVRRRNKVHLAFVAAQPCLVCQRAPCDPHHLKFAQPRTLGRKVSDEFTVPLCREHHRDLHRHGNEIAWWANVQIAPIETAKELWQATLLGSEGVIPGERRQPPDKARRVAD
jgi:hypothetical protein